MHSWQPCGASLSLSAIKVLRNNPYILSYFLYKIARKKNRLFMGYFRPQKE